MARIIKKIVVPRGTVPMLSKEMQVTRACVFGALEYRSNSELSELIRKKLSSMAASLQKDFK